LDNVSSFAKCKCQSPQTQGSGSVQGDAEEVAGESPTSETPTSEMESEAIRPGSFSEDAEEDTAEDDARELSGLSRGATMATLLLSGLLELAAAVTHCTGSDEEEVDCTGMYGFAISVGAISSFFLAVLVSGFVLNVLTDELERAMPLISAALAVWWALGVALLTFHKPFLKTDNGYCMTWFSFALAMWLCMTCNAHTTQLQRATEKAKSLPMKLRACVSVLVMSITEMVAAVVHCGAGNHCGGARGWAVAVGTISVAATAACLIFRRQLLRYAPLIAVLLSAFWAAGALVVTFDAPFKATGNGYFASWGAFMASVWFVETTGGYKNAWLTLVRIVEECLGRSVTGGVPTADTAAVEFEFSGGKPK